MSIAHRSLSANDDFIVPSDPDRSEPCTLINPNSPLGVILPLFGSLSIVCYLYLFWMYFVLKSPLLRRHPTTLAIYKCMIEVLFVQQYLWLPQFSNSQLYSDDGETAPFYCRASKLAAGMSFISQFSLLGSELCFWIISVDLRIAYTNPFTSFAAHKVQFAVTILGCSIATAVLVMLCGPEVYGMSRLGILWIQPRREKRSPNYAQFLLYYFPSLSIFAYCLWANFQYYQGRHKGLSKTFSSRMSIMERSRRYTAAYVVYGLVVFAIEFASFLSGVNFLSVSPVPALFYSSRGVWGLVIILYSNANELSWEVLNPFHLRPPAVNSLVRDVAKERLLLQPHLNSALRAEILFFATQGIIHAALETQKRRQETRLFTFDPNSPSTPLPTMERDDDDNEEVADEAPRESTALRLSLHREGEPFARRLQRIESQQEERLSMARQEAFLNELHSLHSQSQMLSPTDLLLLDNDSRNNNNQYNDGASSSSGNGVAASPVMTDNPLHTSRRLQRPLPSESGLELSGRSGPETADRRQDDNSQDSAQSADTVKWRETMDVEYGLRPTGVDASAMPEPGPRASGAGPRRSITERITAGWRRLRGPTSSQAAPGIRGSTVSVQDESVNGKERGSSVSSLSRTLHQVMQSARAAVSPAYRDFRFKDFSPRVFADIRELEGITAEDYAAAFDSTCRERFSEGRSGAFLFFSKDERFLVKTMSETESVALRGALPNYLTHLRNHRKSLLVRFLGAHSLTMYGVEIFFVVMRNVFPVAIKLSERFDLKGSWVNRHGGDEGDRARRRRRRKTKANRIWVAAPTAGQDRERARTRRLSSLALPGNGADERMTGGGPAAPAPAAQEEASVPLYQDNDLQQTISLQPQLAVLLAETVRADILFLRDQHFMDYSLLIGVQRERFRVLDSQPTSDSGDRDSVGDVSPIARPSIGAGPLQQRSVSRSSMSAPSTRQGSTAVSLSSTPQLPQNPQDVRSFSEGVRAEEVEGPGVFYMGVIDVLQQWDMKKRLERIFKMYIRGLEGDGLSATEPVRYAERFWQRAVLDTFDHLDGLDDNLPKPSDPNSPTQAGSGVEFGAGQSSPSANGVANGRKPMDVLHEDEEDEEEDEDDV